MSYVFKSNKFASIIKKYRKDNYPDQESFANDLGIDRATLSQLENQKTYPTRNQLVQICSKIKMDIGEFFNFEENDPIVLMMGNFTKQTDQRNLEMVMNRINTRMKYYKLHKRIGK